MQAFAIRQKSTGFFLPNFKGRAGGSWVEPEKGALPRLFHRERDAKGYLTVWLKGGVTVTYSDEGDVDWHEKALPHRKSEDMEIVAVKLTVDHTA